MLPNLEMEDTDDKPLYYDKEHERTGENTIFSVPKSKYSTGFSTSCTSKVNAESTNSCRIFELEKNDINKMSSSPSTMTSSYSLN